MDFEKLNGVGVVWKLWQKFLLYVLFDFSIRLIVDDKDFWDGDGLQLLEQVKDDFFVADGKVSRGIVLGKGIEIDVLDGDVDNGDIVVMGGIEHVE